MEKKLRLGYAIAFAVLLGIEILIALFVHDRFIRPYIGDVLVTVLLCCLCRIFVPKGMMALPVCIFAFAALVEIGQYFEIVKLLGLQSSKFFSVLLGTTFSFWDLLCYGIGCLIFWIAEKGIKKAKR